MKSECSNFLKLKSMTTKAKYILTYIRFTKMSYLRLIKITSLKSKTL